MNKQPENSAPADIIVRACKYDGSEHRRWHARVQSFDNSLLILDAAFDVEINHPLLGRIVRGTQSLEYYWMDCWYNVFRFLEPTGELRNYYCNVNVPPTFDGQELSFIDLDMDILVAPDMSYTILDEDEFTVNALRYKYPAEVCRQARRALLELVEMLEKRQFPFDLHA